MKFVFKNQYVPVLSAPLGIITSAYFFVCESKKNIYLI